MKKPKKVETVEEFLARGGSITKIEIEKPKLETIDFTKEDTTFKKRKKFYFGPPGNC